MEVVKQKLGPFQKAWLYDLSHLSADQQGEGRLMTILKGQDKPKYCCLGVAEHLTFGKEPELRDEQSDEQSDGVSCQVGYFENVTAGTGTMFDECGVATNDVIRELRFFDECGSINPQVILLEGSDDPWRALTSANDQGKTFAEIVARIEENPHHYFREPA